MEFIKDDNLLQEVGPLTLVRLPETLKVAESQSLIRFLLDTRDLPIRKGIDVEKEVLNYLAFLTQLSKKDSKITLPSASIELVWQTHILRPKQYIEDCSLLFGSVMDHNLKSLDQISKIDQIDLNIKIQASPLSDFLVKQVIKDNQWFLDFEHYVTKVLGFGDILDPRIFSQSLDRYEVFLQIISQYRTQIKKSKNQLCPDQLIDASWHTHMLNISEYIAFCQAKFKEVIDHEPWPECLEKPELKRKNDEWFQSLLRKMSEKQTRDFRMLPYSIHFPKNWDMNLMKEIFQYLDSSDILSMSSLSRRMREEALSDVVWSVQYEAMIKQVNSGSFNFEHFVGIPPFGTVDAVKGIPAIRKIINVPLERHVPIYKQFFERRKKARKEGAKYFNFIIKCGIPKAEQGQFIAAQSGCCHDVVKPIVHNLWERTHLTFGYPDELRDQICRTISLAVMDEAMDDEGIKQRAIHTIHTACWK